MPVVITDFTNKTWAVEQPDDGYIHVGYSGAKGPRLLDILDFVSVRQKQFDKFVEKRREQEEKERAKRRRVPRVIVE
jgi:hypothetical protein